MKLLLLLLLVIPLIGKGQLDTINIQFRIDRDSFPDCITYFSSNGEYVIPEKKDVSLELDGFRYIDPYKLVYNDWMTIFSAPQMVDELPVFYKDRYSYKEISSATLDSLYHLALKDKPWMSIEEFKRELGISVSIEQVSEEQSVIMTPQDKQSSIEVLSDVVVERTKSRIIDGVNIGGADIKILSVVDGVYMNEKRTYLQRIDFFKEYPGIADSISRQHDSIRLNVLQPRLDSLLKPFYISRTEVTNADYKEFVYYVRDSLALFRAYWDADDDVSLTLLNVGKAVRKKLDPKKKKENLEQFGLKMPDGFWEDPAFVPLCSWIYYPQPERYYKRREVDARKIKYRMNDSTIIAIYPDTLSMLKIETAFMDVVSNMYFWHPAYDHYPVVGVNYDQIKAFCHWKQNQLNKELKIDSYRIRVDIPTLTQYEFALKSTQHILVNEAVNTANNELVPYFRTGWKEPQQFLKKVNTTMNDVHPNNDQLYLNWFKSNYNPIIYYLNGNVSEVIRDEMDGNFIRTHSIEAVSDPKSYYCAIGDNYYMGVKTKDDYQFNALFYKRLLPKQQADGLTGFRLVYTLTPAQ